MRKPVFRGKLLNVFTEKLCLPNGHIVNLETIKHPGAALIVPFLAKDKVMLLRQYRAVIKKYLYELPAGTLNKNESPFSCADREIKEETAYSAKKLTRIGLIYPVPGYSTEKITVYKAEGLEKIKSHMPEKDEIITVKIVTKREVMRLLKKGWLIDAKTICAFVFCGWL